ncbi:MAG: hypothetical protein K5649_00465 [Lachnospiraceae bacterium]|nr:hypothetical protein [Lachnospiraceae bacterium]
MVKNIDDVRKLFHEQQDTMEKEVVDTLNVILDVDDAFLRLPMKTSIGLLRFLGVSKDEVEESYLNLISLENYKPDYYITISNRK